MPVHSAQILLTINLLAAMIWTGGLAAVAVAVVAARQTLEADEQIRFFRALGRRYGAVAGLALSVFAASGLALAGTPSDWTGAETAVAALTATVAGLTVAGVRNARAVQRLRAAALQQGEDGTEDVRLRNARRTAGALRAMIAVVTLAAVIAATV